MTKIEIWKALKEKARKAKKERDSKLESITTCDWATKRKSCIKIIEIPMLGDQGSLSGDLQCYATKNCEKFSDCKACKDVKCPMHKLNNEYIKAKKEFEELKKARRKAFMNIFTRGK